MNLHQATGALVEPDWYAVAAALNLSPQQMEVARGIYRDDKKERIGLDMVLSKHTVDGYIRILYRKLGVSSRVQLVRRIDAVWFRLCMEDGK